MLLTDVALPAALLESDFIALAVVQDRCIVWANAAMHRIYGYEPDELIGKPTRQLYLDQETYEDFGRNVNAALKAGNAYCGVIPQRRKDGSTGWYEFNVSRQAGHADRMVGAIVDRTRSHELSLQLQASEKRYRSVLEDQTEVISRFQPDGTFLFVNDVYCRVFGKSADELVGKRWHPVAHPDDRVIIEAKLTEITPDNPIVNIENRVYVAGGELRWMQFVNRGFFDADGRLSEIQSVGRDVTRIKQAEMALRKSEAALERAQEVARVGSFALAGGTDRFVYSTETARLFGLEERREIAFAEWFSRVHPDDQAAVQAAWHAALEGAPYDQTYRIVVREQVVWIRAVAELTFDAQGGVLECVGTVQDISDLRRSESVLRESEARLEMVLAASGLGCWDADVTTGKLTMDARIGEMLGYSVDELAHLDFWSQLIDPRDRERFKHDLKAHLHGDSEDFRSEHRLLHKNGHWVFVEARGRLIERGAAGTSLRMAGVLMDITQRKRLHDEGVDLLKQIEALIRENVPSRATTKSDARILDGLTRRELQILGMIAQGLSSPEIARQLNLALNTVGTHRQNLMSKLDLHTAVDVTRFAIDHGLLKKS